MIITCIQRGGSVYVYGQGNRMLFSVTGTLVGYTGSSVSVRRGSTVYTYDDHNRMIGSHS